MKTFNLDKAIQVEIKDKKRSNSYVWKPEKKFLGFLLRKEGFYRVGSWRTGPVSEKEILEDVTLTIRGNLVYEKPVVITIYEGGIRSKIAYDDFVSAEIAYWDILKVIPNRLESGTKRKQ